MADAKLREQVELPPWCKVRHVLFFENGSYNYTCPSGLQAGGPWDNRPKKCGGIGCGRVLVEESTLQESTRTLVVAISEVRQRHKEKAKRANFDDCGCDDCLTLDAALAAAQE